MVTFPELVRDMWAHCSCSRPEVVVLLGTVEERTVASEHIPCFDHGLGYRLASVAVDSRR